MKLISMHVNNFGGLHDYDYVFNDGLNVILHDNGWGKTTMAAFLKAMLYGYDTRRSKDITENERKRYLPWQGGKYGGSLDFEADGKRYRIYRTFGETPRFDIAKIVCLDTNTTARIPADKIGETLFHLDANAFQRSVFINQNGLSIDGAASSIHTRLNALISQANDVAAYDGAITRLTQQVKIYEKTGARGLLGDISRQIAEQEDRRNQLDREIAAQDAARERIIQINAQLDSISRELEEKNQKLEAAAGEGKRQEATRKLLADVSARIASFQQQISQLEDELGGSVPTGAQIDQAKQAAQRRAALQEKLQTLETGQADLCRTHEALVSQYGGTMPTVAAIDEIQRLHGELQGLLTASVSDKQREDVPEEYTLIAQAMAGQDDYIPRLQSAIRSSARIQQLQQQIRVQQSDMQREAVAWEKQARRHAALTGEQASHAEKLEALSAYRPEETEAAIKALDFCGKQKAGYSRRLALKQADIQQENKRWADLTAQHQELNNQVTLLQKELDGQLCYAGEIVLPAISALEEYQRLQQRTEDMQVTLHASALTDEEAALLQSYPDELPQAGEGNAMLSSHRNAQRHRAEAQGLASRLEGESSRRNSLQASAKQLDASVTSAPTLVAQPKKRTSAALIGAGVVLVLIGAALAAVATPVLGAIAILGVLLAITGFASRGREQKQEQAWQEYQKANSQYQDSRQQQQQILEQLTAVCQNINALRTQIEDHERIASAEEAAISAWLARWGEATTDDAESAIQRVMEQASKIAHLRGKQDEFTRLQHCITEQIDKADAVRAAINKQYPTIKDLSCSEAIAFLHSAHARQQLAAEQLQNAQQRLANFVAEAKRNGCDPAARTSPLIAEYQKELQDLTDQIRQQDNKRAELDAQYPEIAGLSTEDAISLLQQRLSAYRLEESQLKSVRHNLDALIREAGVTEEELLLPQSPWMTKLQGMHSTTVSELEQLVQQANLLLKPLDLDVDADRMGQALNEADDLLSVYLQHHALLADSNARQNKTRLQAESLQQRIAEGLTAMGVQAGDADLPQILPVIRENIAQDIQLQEKLKDVNGQIPLVKAELAKAETVLAQFHTAHGHFMPEQGDLLTAIGEKAAAHAELTAARQQLEQQRASMEQTHQAAAAAQTISANEAALRAIVASLKDKREALLIEYTQHSDAIRQADRALERYPLVICEIRQLYEQKQKALNTLSVLKRTIQLITAAKENLATRYLSKVEQLFNSYMQIWLKNDAIRGVLDIDFNVSIQENDKVHIAQGYSAGYCDMIDFCMRLALVDTLFEKEQPFLILDDPFVNLDASRLENALELLSVMAADKQIIYFVCHPIRAVETAENTALRTEFMQLSEAARRNAASPRGAGTSRTTATRKSPREMYHVCESAASKALLPARPNFTITNSIFSMNFVAGETAGAQDYSFELFFIDAAGRVLNDRQIIEIRDGKLSAERIQFNLNTRDDSGDTFELMIRQSGHDDYELAARFPFRAKLAFTGTFSFDL